MRILIIKQLYNFCFCFTGVWRLVRRPSSQDDVHQWRAGVPGGLQQESVRRHHHQQDQQRILGFLRVREDGEKQQQFQQLFHFQQFRAQQEGADFTPCFIDV